VSTKQNKKIHLKNKNMTTDYLELVSMIIEDQLSLEAFIRLSGVDQDSAEAELQRLAPVVQTFTTDPKPIYFFKSYDYPNLGHLFHCTKLFTFAHGGSPYKDGAQSQYDTRKDCPYIQAAVYDNSKGAFITGLRFLPLSKISSFDMSVMNSLHHPTDIFKEHYIHNTVEIGQTFVSPEAGATAPNYLFNTMSAVIAANKDARYLSGKPTIEGRIPDISKEIISAFAYDTFHPLQNNEFNPSGKPLFLVVDGIVQPKLRSLSEIVHQYNLDVGDQHPQLEYLTQMPIQKKRKLTEKLLVYYGGALPPMFKFYAVLTEENGMIVLAQSVINPVYTTQAWEFPILLDKLKIVPVYRRLIDQYVEYFKDKAIQF